MGKLETREILNLMWQVVVFSAENSNGISSNNYWKLFHCKQLYERQYINFNKYLEYTASNLVFKATF